MSVRSANTLRLDLKSIEAGIPTASIPGFVAASGLPLQDVYEIVIPARTLKHRRSRKEPLTLDESDKFARLIRTYDQAVRVLGSRQEAIAWLDAPKRRFNHRTPLHMLRTEYGGRMVEEMLGQIDEGMFA